MSDDSDAGSRAISRIAPLEAKPDHRPRADVRAPGFAAFSGPLPPPSLFAEYEAAHPGTANRIIALAERSQEHRHDLEKRSLEAAIERQRWGMLAASSILFHPRSSRKRLIINPIRTFSA